MSRTAEPDTLNLPGRREYADYLLEWSNAFREGDTPAESPMDYERWLKSRLSNKLRAIEESQRDNP